MMKKLLIILMCVCLAGFCGCGAESDVIAVIDSAAVSSDSAARGEAVSIALSGDKASVSGKGASFKDGELLISQGGVYRLSGALNGCVTIDCDGAVELVLCDAAIGGEGWAIYARDCEALMLTLCDGTASRLAQSAAADENGVCLESKAPVTIRGGGSLTIEAAGIGLRASGALNLESGALTVNAADLGVKAKSDGLITVSGGSLTVNAGSDAVKAASFVQSGGTVSLTAGERGVDSTDFALSGGTLSVASADDGIKTESLLSVSGGTLAIEAGCDGLQSEGDVEISGGNLAIVCAGGGGQAINRKDSGGVGGFGFGSSSSSEIYEMPEYSCKAVKADGGITITGGTLTLDGVDDTIHAAGNIEIADVFISICSSDDAIHSDSDLTVHSGTILINDCFEGLEAATITINGGDLDIYSVNDGINASSGSGGFGFGGDGAVFIMNGGEVDIFVTGTSSNLGDGIDSNGSIYINGGRITASTDGSTMENGIDSGSSFVVTGGILAASGNSGMQESPSTSSTQCAAVLTLSGGISAGTECVITDSQGNVVMTYTPYRWASCLVVSHPDFTIGETYTLTAGDQTKTFTFTSVSYSERGGFGFGGGPGGRPF